NRALQGGCVSIRNCIQAAWPRRIFQEWWAVSGSVLSSQFFVLANQYSARPPLLATRPSPLAHSPAPLFFGKGRDCGCRWTPFWLNHGRSICLTCPVGS